MRKLFFTLFIFNLFSIPVLAQQDIQFVPEKKSMLLLDHEYPTVYKPSKLIIGKETKFKIKAKQGSFVSLATSYSNSGADQFFGQKLRLGNDLITKEGIIPENGLLELGINLPDDKNLTGKTMYFEVAVWKDKNYKDIKLAKIMASNGRQTNFNGIEIGLQSKNSSMPEFIPALPGMPLDLIRTIDEVKDNKNSDTNYPNRRYNIENNPLLRNLNIQRDNGL